MTRQTQGRIQHEQFNYIIWWRYNKYSKLYFGELFDPNGVHTGFVYSSPSFSDMVNYLEREMVW